MQRITRRTLLRAGLGSVAAPYAFAQRRDEPVRKNVLLLLIDDLRPMLGCYGNAEAVTPNIDALSKRGLTFLSNHCQIASDSPSRQSMFTGLRPDAIGVFDEGQSFRARRPGAATLPQYFRQRGYFTKAVGTVLPDAPSWNEADARLVEASFAQSWAESEHSDSELYDGQTARKAVDALKRFGGRSFFLAVGFERPSLPFIAPKDYFALHPRAYVKPLASPAPDGAPTYAVPSSPEFRKYIGIPASGELDADLSRDLIRAYMASVTYVDEQIGLVVKALEDQGLRQDTVIVLTSDSGFHFGEQGFWGKQANFDAATRTPLIISAFGRKSAGRKTRAMTEAVDLYPTVCELAGLPVPRGLDGASAALLFQNPDRLWKRAVFTQQPREIPGVGPGMGYSMRTPRYRYTEWSAIGSPFKTAELYDYKDVRTEVENIANQPRHQTLENGMSAILREGWQGSLPPSDPRSGTTG